MSVFGKRLKKLREAAGLTRTQLGIDAGLDEASVSARMSQYESGKHLPELRVITKIGKVLDAPAAYFFAEFDELAELVLWYHRASPNKRKAVLRATKTNSVK